MTHNTNTHKQAHSHTRAHAQEGALLAYILFGFGFIVALISGLGLFGVRQNSQEFLRVVRFWL